MLNLEKNIEQINQMLHKAVTEKSTISVDKMVNK